MDIARMKLGQGRGLTTGEIAIGRSIFGNSVDWTSVRIFQARFLGFGAMVPFGRTIVFSKWRAAADFSKVSAAEQGWFVHELAHVWQAKRGVLLAAAKLSALGKHAYAYLPRTGACLKNYNIERQAEIARHLFLERVGAPELGAPQRAWLEDVWAKR